MITLSKLELAVKCLHWTAIKTPYEPSGPAAEFGTEFHKHAARYLQTRKPSVGVPDSHDVMVQVWQRYAADRFPRDVKVEAAYAWTPDACGLLGYDIGRRYKERGAKPTDICGSLDVWWFDDATRRLHIADHKTGRARHTAAESWQLAGAAVMLLDATRFVINSVDVAYSYVNARGEVTTDAAVLTDERMGEVRREMRRLHVEQTGKREPVPGAHCEDLWCPARKVCSAAEGFRKENKQAAKKATGGQTMTKMKLTSVTTGKMETPFRVVLYGPEGIGKSTFAAGAPAPIFVGEHGGTAHLDVARFPSPEAWEDVFAALSELAEAEHGYRTVVIDPLDAFEPLVWDYVCRQGKKKNIEDFGYGKGYVQAQAEFQRLLDALNALSRGKSLNVVVLAHSHVKPFRNPTGDDYDTYELKLHTKSAALVRGWPDAVLFANYETYTHEVDGRTKAVGDGSRIVHTEARPAWHAKNRYALPPTMPLDWAEFERAAREHVPGNVTTLRAAILDIATQLPEATRSQAGELLKKAGDDAIKLAKLRDWASAKLNIEKQETAA